MIRIEIYTDRAKHPKRRKIAAKVSKPATRKTVDDLMSMIDD